MKETLQIPTPEMLENPIGKELYNVWDNSQNTQLQE